MNFEKLEILPVNSESITSFFSDAMTQALHSLNTDGRLTADAARMIFRAVKKTPSTFRLKVAFAPGKYLGPFESLPLDAQRAILRAIGSEDTWCMAGHEIGDWHISMTRFLTRLRWKLSQYRLSHLAKLAEILAIGVQSGPAHILHAIYKLQLYLSGRISTRPTLRSILNIAEIKPWDLAICYAQNIPQPMAYRGFWHDPSRHNTYGVVLGIDLLPTPNGCWYIESNLNFGMSNTRSDLYDRDPFVTNLVEFAADQGYRHLMIVSNTSSYMNKVMAKQFEETALARKLKLTIVEDAYLPKSDYIQSFGVPSLDGDRTLVVRTKFYRTSLDYLFQHKRASYRALETYKQYSSDPALLLPVTSVEPVLGNADKDDPFPNLVYKLPERDEGKGVIFLKATSLDHAHTILEEAIRLNRQRGFKDRLYSLIEDQNGLYQSYVRSPLLPGRILYKVRAHVLLTPVGVQFLSAHRVISRFMVPEHLPFGVVQDPRPYLVNLASSSEYRTVPSDEEPAVEMSALSVAKGLGWAAVYGFQTTPPKKKTH